MTDDISLCGVSSTKRNWETFKVSAVEKYLMQQKSLSKEVHIY